MGMGTARFACISRALRVRASRRRDCLGERRHDLRALAAPTAGTLVDAGFENGTDGADLSARVDHDRGAPAEPRVRHRTVQDGLQVRLRARAASGHHGGRAHQRRRRHDVRRRRDPLLGPLRREHRLPPGHRHREPPRIRAYLKFTTDGCIYAYTSKTSLPTGYVTGDNKLATNGTYAANTWTQYRIVHNFTTDTYQLSRRASAADAWTPIKAAGATTNDIPMRGTGDVDPVQRHRALPLRQLQHVARRRRVLGHRRYSDAPAGDTQAPSAPANFLAFQFPTPRLR